MVNKKEIWIDIIGYEDMYQVSTFGRIKSLNRIVKHPNGKSDFPIRGRIRAFNIRNNYFGCTVNKDNKKIHISVHRFVAIHFIPNPENKPQVNHIDGNKLNNNVENLEWCTAKENTKHAIKNGLLVHKRGEQKTQSILTEEAVIEIRKIDKYDIDAKNLAQIKYGVSRSAINDVIARRKWKHVI